MKEMPFLQKYIFVLSVLLLSVKCEEWECGNDCKAILVNGVLTVQGNGEMNHFSSSSTPWYSSRKLIKSAVIEDGITTIGGYAFEGCSALTSIKITEDVMIGSFAFHSCSSLTSIIIPSKVTAIEQSAFNGCSSLTSITIPNNVKRIGFNAFLGCSQLKSISIPDSVTEIDQYAFKSCSLSSIVFPDTLQEIGINAFYECNNITEFILPKSIRRIHSNRNVGSKPFTQRFYLSSDVNRSNPLSISDVIKMFPV